MAIPTIDALKQYTSVLAELDETEHKINNLEAEITKLKNQIHAIENGEMVKDKVYGGEGGIQGFVIEGVPTKEWSDAKTKLQRKKMMLVQRKADAEMFRMLLEEMVIDVERFVRSITDSETRRIIEFRFLQRKSWMDVAKCMGQGYSSDAVRKTFERFMQKNA